MKTSTHKSSEKVLSVVMAFLCFLMLCPVNVSAASYNGRGYSADWRAWKQSDPAWASRPLGNLCNMSNSGCLITSLAILMAKSGAENPNSFNPGVLRDRYESRGFVSHARTVAADGNLSYAAYSKTNSPKFYQVASSNYHPTPYNAIYNDIANHLARGQYAIVQVNYGGHFVAVDRCSNGTVYIVDPARSGKTTLKQYDGGIEMGIFFEGGAPKDTTKPIISNVRVSDVSCLGYTVTCTVKDNVKVTSVRFPTWTTYAGQDELIWHTGTISGNTASCRINRCDHKNEFGQYITDIYAYDAQGNVSGKRSSANVPTALNKNPGRNVSNGVYYILSSVNPQYGLSIHGYTKKARENIHLWKAGSSKYQQFEFRYVSNGYYTIKNVGSGLYMDADNYGYRNGTNVLQYPYHGRTNQLWRLIPLGNNRYYITPKCSNGCCVDLNRGNAKNGENIQLYTENHRTSQIWYLSKGPKWKDTRKPQTIVASDLTKKRTANPFYIPCKRTKGNGKITFSSSDEHVVKVYSDGRAVIRGAGTVTITIKAAATSTYKAATKKIKIKVVYR